MSEAVNEMPNFYAVIPADVRYDEDLSSTAKLLYAEISALANSKGYCFATNAYFAQLYKLTTRNVANIISQLAKKGYIEVVNGNSKKRKIFISTMKKISYVIIQVLIIKIIIHTHPILKSGSSVIRTVSTRREHSGIGRRQLRRTDWRE